jgi:hypothetical protein
LPRNCRIQLSIPFHEQTRTQGAQQIAPKSDFSDQVQASLVVTRLEQARESFEKIAFSKVLEITAALRCVDQIDGKEWEAWNSGPL